MEKLPNKSSPRVEQKGVNQKFYIHTGNGINDNSDSYYNRVETTATATEQNTTQMTMTIKQDGNDDDDDGKDYNNGDGDDDDVVRVFFNRRLLMVQKIAQNERENYK